MNDAVIPHVWEQQQEINVLLASGFAEFWRVSPRTGRPLYTWTEAGKEACFRSVYTTPMAWAEDMHAQHTRHCVVCGRDCFRKRVWVQDGPFLCVCTLCGMEGHGLSDIARVKRSKSV